MDGGSESRDGESLPSHALIELANAISFFLVILRDQTRLKACFRDGKVAIDIAGNAFSVAEIAEQIAWMGAALRSSPDDDKAAAYCTAHLAELHINSLAMAHHSSVEVYTGFCTIGFKTELL